MKIEKVQEVWLVTDCDLKKISEWNNRDNALRWARENVKEHGGTLYVVRGEIAQ